MHALRIRSASSSHSPYCGAGWPTLTATPRHCPPQRSRHCLYHRRHLRPPIITPSSSVISILLVIGTKTSTTIPPGCCRKTRTKTRLLSQRCRPFPAVVVQSAWCSAVVPSVVCHPPPPLICRPQSLLLLLFPRPIRRCHIVLVHIPPNTRLLWPWSRAVPPPLAL